MVANRSALPVSLATLLPEHQYAVIRLPTDHPGELEAMLAVAAPQIGILTNVHHAHLAAFESRLNGWRKTSQASLPTSTVPVLRSSTPTTNTLGAPRRDRSRRNHRQYRQLRQRFHGVQRDRRHSRHRL
ncbi:MAG: hypothetical protein HND48_08745 [Chloroflexi bacterium]|nr:hypothetical protein [Chloroflexota bacterium]